VVVVVSSPHVPVCRCASQVDFFANAPVGVKFIATGDRLKVFRRLTPLAASAKEPTAAVAAATAEASDGVSEEAVGPSGGAGKVKATTAAAGGTAAFRKKKARKLGSSANVTSSSTSTSSSYSRDEYVADLLRSRFCLHLQVRWATSFDPLGGLLRSVGRPPSIRWVCGREGERVREEAYRIRRGGGRGGKISDKQRLDGSQLLYVSFVFSLLRLIIPKIC
jgi:hypothetical protein